MTPVLEPAPAPDRRGLLRALAGMVGVGLAGCVSGDRDGETGGSAPTTDAGEDETSSTVHGDRATPTATDDSLDMREANVVGVSVGATDGGHRFAVTLVHDDDGEPGYADWWQVETVGGDRLGRRELLHAHGTEPFTRSATVAVPEGTRCVVVRGHDATHGYGGQAMTVDLVGGTTRPIRQGPEPRSMAVADCPGA